MRVGAGAAWPAPLCSTCRRPLQRPLPCPRAAGAWRSGRRRAGAAAAAAPLRSFDDSDLDNEVARELARYSDPELLRRRAERLELVWSVGKRRKPAPCDCCDGSGERPCSWCNATGAMRVGEHVFCSLDSGCKPCPICNSKGAVKCSHCKGTGFRAGWLEPGCPT